MDNNIPEEYLRQIQTQFSDIEFENAGINGIDGMPLGMAYVPIQNWRQIYINDVALSRGTIFEELDLPFLGTGV